MNDFWKLKKIDESYVLRYRPLKVTKPFTKFKPMGGFAFKRPKFNMIDSDRDGVPDIADCAKNDPRRQGVMHSIVGSYKKKKAPQTISQAQDLMSQADFYISEGQKLMQIAELEGDEESYTYGQQLVAEGEAMMLQAQSMDEEAQVQYTEGEEMVGAEKERIQENIRTGLRIKRGAWGRGTRRGRGGGPKMAVSFWGSTTRPSRKTHYEMVEYRPISREQTTLKYNPVTSPYIDQVRNGQPYRPPVSPQPFRPIFIGRPRPLTEEVYYED
jgi:hypothetical protein